MCCRLSSSSSSRRNTETHSSSRGGLDADKTSNRLNLISCHLFLRQALFHTQTKQMQPKQKDMMKTSRAGVEQK